MNSVRKLVLNPSSLKTVQGTLFRSFHATPKAATTIVCVRKNGKICMMGDGMVSAGSLMVKPNAVKIRRIMPKGSSEADKANGGTVVGFAGSTADAFTLLERLESKLDEYPGQLKRSCVELAKGWRTDKYLRRLEASLIVADASASLELTGNGDVLESHDGILGVGSGSPYAIGKRTCRFVYFADSPFIS
jgi:ATP-dependent HslUV protease subunit HslV